MKKEISYAVKNVFRRALEAKQDFGGEDGTVPAPVAELCFSPRRNWFRKSSTTGTATTLPKKK